MNGLELLEIIVAATGLPKEAARAELERLASSHSASLENIKLDKLREILASYLQDTLLSQLEDSST